MEENQTEIKKENEIKYTEAEEIVIDNADKMLEFANSAILRAKQTIAHAWKIQVNHNKELETETPYVLLLDMLKFYVDKCEKDYTKYCRDNNIKSIEHAIDKLSEEDKKVVLHPLKQVNFIK